MEEFFIQGVACRIAIQPAHSEAERQRELGGSFLSIEFESAADSDLIAVAREGFELIEDFLSAITIVNGVTFSPSRVIQVARRTNNPTDNCEFIQFLSLEANHWHEVISAPMLTSARKLLAHWDGLESGKRLRRAARRYREAAGTLDDVSAFLKAYTGLETLEPPLARTANLTPGTEEIQGKCENCKASYIRKKTTLVGLRNYVLDGEKPDQADEQRHADWKLINKLRNDITHGLTDDATLGSRPYEALIASMHYLHDAISLISHSIEEPTERYQLARGSTLYLIIGRYTAKTWAHLSKWKEIVETSTFSWVRDPIHGLVPEMTLRNDGIKDLLFDTGRLDQPLSFASMNDIRSARMVMTPIDAPEGTFP